MTGPLHNCRVLDLGIITAGAATSALLADLGAEVIKVESPSFRDPFRRWTGAREHLKGKGSPFFYTTNRNKLTISLDLKSASGRAAFLRMVSKSGIVVENFRRGVLERLGISFDVLKAANPNIILGSISSQGETGPDADYVSYGSTLEAMGGLAWQTRYRDGEPAISGRALNYPDQVASLFAAGMILSAWQARGSAVHLDLSQRELTTFLCGEAFVAGGTEDGSGNDAEPHMLQDCFAASDDIWVAVTVDTMNLAALEMLLGVPGSSTGNLAAALARFIGSHTASESVATLLAAGIAAAIARGGNELIAEPMWKDAFFAAQDPALLKGFPFQIDEMPLAIRRELPELGTDTEDVLKRVAGLSDAEIAELVRSGAAELRNAGASQAK